MASGRWLAALIAIAAFAFYSGFQISVHTGTEPGYFDAVEAAGYGGGGGEKIEGLSEEMNAYYQSLTEEEE